MEARAMRPNVFLFIIVCCSVPVCAQARSVNGDASGNAFLIDSTKPYVYLEMDHIGRRKALLSGESEQGIWLRLHNNSNVPITIISIRKKPGKQEPIIALADEVVPTPQPSRGDGLEEVIHHAPDEDGLLDIFKFS